MLKIVIYESDNICIQEVNKGNFCAHITCAFNLAIDLNEKIDQHFKLFWKMFDQSVHVTLYTLRQVEHPNRLKEWKCFIHVYMFKLVMVLSFTVHRGGQAFT